MQQGQQQIPIQQQTSQQNPPQPTPQQQTQINIPSQPQQNVFQNNPQQMQVSQANVQNMTNLQTVHSIMPQSSQSIPQVSVPVYMNVRKILSVQLQYYQLDLIFLSD